MFGDVIWSVTDDLNITVGLRYTDDSKDFTWLNESNNWDPNIVDIAFNPADGHLIKDQLISASESWQDISPRLVLDYHWRDGLMTFLSLAQVASTPWRRIRATTRRPWITWSWVSALNGGTDAWCSMALCITTNTTTARARCL